MVGETSTKTPATGLHLCHFLHPSQERSFHSRRRKVRKKRYNSDCTQAPPQVE
jgi:hypothetical protein